MATHEPHSNPLAPSDDEMDLEEKPKDVKEKLNNADFRRLMMTPMMSGGVPGTPQVKPAFANPEPVDAKAAKKKKKSHYAQFKKSEADKEKDAASKYRDRAKERRENLVVDTDKDLIQLTTSSYNAVESHEEKRQRLIKESKYMGGDLESTHLVKGLDLVLLNKAKADIDAKEREQKEKDMIIKTEEEKNNDITFKTKMCRNVIRITSMENESVKRNDNFLPRRMVYVFDFDNPEEECPVTLIRSKAELGIDSTTSNSDNDIVISKLINIVSKFRQDTGKGRRRDKKHNEGSRFDDKTRPEKIDMFSSDIDFKPMNNQLTYDMSKPGGDGRRSYFLKPSEEENKFETPKMNINDIINNVTEKYGQGVTKIEDEDAKLKKRHEVFEKLNKRSEYDDYFECYPDVHMEYNIDAGGDTDEEPDFTQMDQGKKKGPVGRWDFENQEDYSEYMYKKEALPKAAFQFGVKMADGRKTRRNNQKNNNKKIDQQLAQVNEIMNKRKADPKMDSAIRKKFKY